MGLYGLRFLETGFDEIRQFQIFEKEFEKFLAGQGENELIFPFAAIRTFFAAATAATASGFCDLVACYKFLIAREDALAGAAPSRMTEPRFTNSLGRNRYFAVLSGVRNLGAIDRLIDDLFDLFAGAPP